MKYSVLLLFLLPLFLCAQKKDTVLKYLNADLKPVKQAEAVYVGVAIRQVDNWLLYALYPDTTPVIKAYFKDRNLTVKDGPYELYFPGRKLAQQGTYRDNRKIGNWQTWFPNGLKKDSGLMDDNQLIGEWKHWYDNGRLRILCAFQPVVPRAMEVSAPATMKDILGSVRQGEYRSWYSSGQPEAEGWYVNDQMDSTWKWYHENGQRSTEEIYRNGKLARLTCYDSSGTATGDFCPLSRPAVLKGIGDYQKVLLQHLTWPEEALKKKIEGEVVLRLKINRLGQLEKAEVLSRQEPLRKAVLDMLQYMKDWYPAISHNRPVDWEDEMTIPFYRQQ